MSSNDLPQFKGGDMLKLAEALFDKNRDILVCSSCGKVGTFNRDSVKGHRRYKCKNRSCNHTIGIKHLLEELKADTSGIDSGDSTSESESTSSNMQDKSKKFSFGPVGSIFTNVPTFSSSSRYMKSRKRPAMMLSQDDDITFFDDDVIDLDIRSVVPSASRPTTTRISSSVHEDSFFKAEITSLKGQLKDTMSITKELSGQVTALTETVVLLQEQLKEGLAKLDLSSISIAKKSKSNEAKKKTVCFAPLAKVATSTSLPIEGNNIDGDNDQSTVTVTSKETSTLQRSISSEISSSSTKLTFAEVVAKCNVPRAHAAEAIKSLAMLHKYKSPLVDGNPGQSPGVKQVYVSGLPYITIRGLKSHMYNMHFMLSQIYHLSYVSKTTVEILMAPSYYPSFVKRCAISKLDIMLEYDPSKPYSDNATSILYDKIKKSFVTRLQKIISNEKVIPKVKTFYTRWLSKVTKGKLPILPSSSSSSSISNQEVQASVSHTDLDTNMGVDTNTIINEVDTEVSTIVISDVIPEEDGDVMFTDDNHV